MVLTASNLGFSRKKICYRLFAIMSENLGQFRSKKSQRPRFERMKKPNH